MEPGRERYKSFKVNKEQTKSKFDDNYYDLVLNNNKSWYSGVSEKIKTYLTGNPAKNGEYLSFKNGIIYNGKRKVANLKKDIIYSQIKKDVKKSNEKVFSKIYDNYLWKQQLYYRKKGRNTPLLKLSSIKEFLKKYASLDYVNKKNILKDFNYLVEINPKLSKNGYNIYVDKRLQKLFLINVYNGRKDIVGYVKVSTGVFKGHEYNRINYKYPSRETPNILVEIKPGYSMPNSANRKRTGYGLRGTKVVPLGNYNIDKWGNYNLAGKVFDTSLLIHGTTIGRNKLLGTKQSLGCVRTKDIGIDILNNLNENGVLNYAVIWDGDKNNLPKDVNK